MSITRSNLRTLAPQPRRLIRPLLAAGVVAGVLAPSTAAFAADSSLAQIERQIAVESGRLEKVVEQYNKINEEYAASRAAAKKVAAKLKPLAAQLALADQQIGALATEAYKGRAVAELGAVLTAPNPAAVIDRLITLDKFARGKNAQITTFLAVKASYDTQAARLQLLVADQKAKRAELTAQRSRINADLARLNRLRQQAYGNAQPTRFTSASPPAVSGQAGVAVRYAYGALGKPYVWGAAGPNGYDCSGLTMAAWRAAGVSLPHNARMQWWVVTHITRAALRPGDLVFYSQLGHVAIYVGGGRVIHAPTFGDVVRLASVDMMPPYGYGRP